MKHCSTAVPQYEASPLAFRCEALRFRSVWYKNYFNFPYSPHHYQILKSSVDYDWTLCFYSDLLLYRNGLRQVLPIISPGLNKFFVNIFHFASLHFFCKKYLRNCCFANISMILCWQYFLYMESFFFSQSLFSKGTTNGRKWDHCKIKWIIKDKIL